MKKVVLVTGGGRGIGLGISKALAAEGCSLVICGVREENDVSSSLAELRALGSEVLYCQCDISDPAARERMLNTIDERFGSLHVLINNAGVAPKVRADILEATEESYEWVMKVNLQGPYFLTQAVARRMVTARQMDPQAPRMILFVSSISSTVASIARGEYCLSKAGVSMACQLWSVRLGEYGIPVYEIRPGVIATDMTSGVKEKYDRLIEGGLCITPRWGLPEDVGKAAASLVRGDFPYSTGQVLMVDGGLTTQRL